VVSIERIKALHERARAALNSTRGDSLRLVFGDGTHGHAPNAPYDSIIAAAGGDALPQAWLDQLAVGGRLIAPVRERGSTSQVLVVVDREEERLVQSRHEAVMFVPLKSGLIA
jgi:protein-L-isoaspartate(D-aspartate) O-methyltransferase